MTAIRLAWGACLWLRPDAVLRRCPGTEPSRAGRAVVRALGARDVLQGLATAGGVWPASWRGVPDALHAASMACLAVRSRRWRTAAVADALVAGTFAVQARRGTGTPRRRRGRWPALR